MINISEFDSNEIAIKNLYEMNIDLKESQMIFSDDLKYGIIYNELSISVVDLHKRSIITKCLLEPNSKIRKIKITPDNNLTYICEFSGKVQKTQIVISSLSIIGEYYEITIDRDIEDYLYVNRGKGQEDLLFIITRSGELQIYSELIRVYSSNIFNDAYNYIKLTSISVLELFYVKDTGNLLIFLKNGRILNYSLISNNSEMIMSLNDVVIMEDVPQYGFVSLSKTTIEITTIKHIKGSLDSANIFEDLSLDINIGSKVNDFIIIGYTKNDVESYLVIYELQKSLNHLNKFKFPSFCITEANIYQPQSIIKEQLPDTIVLLGKDTRMGGYRILYSDFLECFGNREEMNSPFYELNHLNDPGIFKIAIESFSVSHNTNYIQNSDNDNESVMISNLNKARFDREYVLGVILKIILITNDSYFLVDHLVQNTQIKDRINVVEEGLSYEFNEFFKFFEKYSKNKDILNTWEAKISSIIQNEYKSFNIPDDPKIDYYLLFLIHSNKIFSLKKYLSVKNINENSFLVSNEILFFNVYKVYFKNLKDIFIKNLNENNVKLLLEDIFLENMEILLELLKLSKYRAENPNFQPFEVENVVIEEDSSEIREYIEEIEKHIFLLKIIRAYIENIVNSDDFIYEELEEDIKNKRKSIEKLFEKNYLNMIIPQINDYPDHYSMFYYFLNNFGKSTIFQMFHYYYYYICDVSLMFHNRNQKSFEFAFIERFFDEMEDEFEKYSKISENLFKFEMYKYGEDIKEKINTSTISMFIWKQNEFLTKHFQEAFIDRFGQPFSSIFIEQVFFEGHCKEALAMSQRIIINELNPSDITTQMMILLKMNLIEIAYIYLTSSFLKMLKIDENQLNSAFLLNILKSNEFDSVKQLYSLFFDYLIKNGFLNFLLTIPMNFIEKYIFKQFLSSNDAYIEILLIYYLKNNNFDESKNIYDTFVKDNFNINKESKLVYEGLIQTLFYFKERNPKQILQIRERIGKIDQLSVQFIQENQIYRNMVTTNLIDFNKKDISIASILDLDDRMNINDASIIDSNIKSFIEQKVQTAKKTYGWTEKKAVPKTYDRILETNKPNDKRESWINKIDFSDMNIFENYTPVNRIKNKGFEVIFGSSMNKSGKSSN